MLRTPIKELTSCLNWQWVCKEPLLRERCSSGCTKQLNPRLKLMHGTKQVIVNETCTIQQAIIIRRYMNSHWTHHGTLLLKTPSTYVIPMQRIVYTLKLYEQEFLTCWPHCLRPIDDSFGVHWHKPREDCVLRSYLFRSSYVWWKVQCI